jgi:hypothetical protein
MLFWLILILFIATLALAIWQNYECEYGIIFWTNFILAMITGCIFAIMMIILPLNHIGVNAEVEKNKEIYNAITYKIESGVCRDEFGLLNKEVVDEIQTWNTELKYKQNIQDDFWLGIFYPNIYDQFECIDYSNYKRE